MAIGTAAAIGMGVSAGISAIQAGASFSAASKQKRLQKEAMQDAEKAMQEAKAKLNVNYYDVLGVQKEPYELQREAALAQGAQAIEAARESDRGVAATAGRLQMAQNQMQSGIRSDMAKEMQTLDKLKAAEESRLQAAKVNIDLAEAEGAQKAAADAQKAAAASTAQGIQALGNIGSSIMGGLAKPFGAIQGAASKLSGGATPAFQTVGTESQPIVTPSMAPGTESLGSIDISQQINPFNIWGTK